MSTKLHVFIIAVLLVITPVLVISILNVLADNSKTAGKANIAKAENCVRDGGQWVPQHRLILPIAGDGFCVLPKN